MFRNKYSGLSLEEKRKLYVCGNSYVGLADIPLWPVLYKKVKAPSPPSVRARAAVPSAQKISAESNIVGVTYATQAAQKATGQTASTPTPEADCDAALVIKPVREKTIKTDVMKSDINQKISLWQGDITKLEIDAIVNGSNTTLRDKGGEHHSIHKIAGPTLMKECLALNGCATGEAKITSGHKLPTKYIIHTVGPIGKHEANLLQKCYENCLRIVLEYNIKSVAFCCISTGMYGYPNREAAEIALKTVRKWLVVNSEKIERIIFCTFLSRDFQIYQRLMSNKYFPCECNYKEKPVKAIVIDEDKENVSSESTDKHDDGTANNIQSKCEANKHARSRGIPSSHRSTVASGNKKIAPRQDDAASDFKAQKKIYLREKSAAYTYKMKEFKVKPAVPRGFKPAPLEVEVNGISDNCTTARKAPEGVGNLITQDYISETGTDSSPDDGSSNTSDENTDGLVNITDEINNNLNASKDDHADIDIEVNDISATYTRERVDSDKEVNHISLEEEINDTFDEGIPEQARPQPEIYYTYNSGISRYSDMKPVSYIRNHIQTSAELKLNSKYYSKTTTSDYPTSKRVVGIGSERNDISDDRIYKHVDYKGGLMSDSCKTNHFNGRFHNMIHRYNGSSIHKI